MADFARTVLQQLPVEEYPYFHEHAQQHIAQSVRDKRPFEFGLDLILDRLDALRDERAGRSARGRRGR